VRVETRILVGLLTLSAFVAAQPATTVVFEGLKYSDPGATFDHGYVAAWDLHHVHSVTLYAPDGRRLFEVSSFKLPDGTATNAPLSVAIDSDGVSAYVYLAARATRSGMAILDAAGNQVRIVETEPYKPSQVCFAPDHSIWMFGDQWGTNDMPAPDFMTFRHYSRDGTLLGSYVPRSALPNWQGGGLDQVVAPVTGHWRLRASKDRIGAAFLVEPSTQTWIELNLDGQLVGQWTYETNVREGVTPAAFDSDGKLYGQRWVNHERAGISIFDKSDGSWKPIFPLPNAQLLGADGVRLVFQTGDLLQWIQPGESEPITGAALTQP
jgi:hypothetical protein